MAWLIYLACLAAGEREKTRGAASCRDQTRGCFSGSLEGTEAAQGVPQSVVCCSRTGESQLQTLKTPGTWLHGSSIRTRISFTRRYIQYPH